MTLITKLGLSVTAVMVLVAAALLGFYGAAGSYVAEDGLLVEEFWALALGSFSLIGATFVGLLTAAISLVRVMNRKRNHPGSAGL